VYNDLFLLNRCDLTTRSMSSRSVQVWKWTMYCW